MATKRFDNAKKNKADEFYTRIEDIQLELKNYKEYFKGKTIFCNCDDPYESNFFKYFALNFNTLKLKKLIATCYNNSPIVEEELTIFNYLDELKNKKNKKQKQIKNNKEAFKIIITEIKDYNKDNAIDELDVKWLLKNKKNVLSTLKGDGDFRSEECIELLKETDIVVTNPPFSLFREYVALIDKMKKKFIIIGNTNALTYKEIFAMFQKDKIRTGYTNFNVGMYFRVPNYYEKYTKFENNIKYARVSTSCWFTNLPVKKHNDLLVLTEKYDKKRFPKYDNYDAINIDTYKDIPKNYNGKMGVPITFLDKYNPKQFEIIALGIVGSIKFTSERKMEILKNGKATGKYTINAKGTLYKKYDSKTDTKPPAFKDCKTGELYQSIYARIIIKKKGNK